MTKNIKGRAKGIRFNPEMERLIENYLMAERKRTGYNITFTQFMTKLVDDYFTRHEKKIVHQ